MCNGVIRPNIDYVYASFRLGDQSKIAELINKNIKDLERAIADHDDVCVKQVFRVVCYFYLPPCGNSSHFARPTSICQEECHMVQTKCRKTWDIALLAFKTIDPVIHCNDTSRLLFPVPHCCTDAGLG